MPTDIVSDVELVRTLLAVGADRTITALDFDKSFEDLDLDSLARAEFAAKVKDASKVDIEEQLTADTTPNQIRRLVQDELAARTGM